MRAHTGVAIRTPPHPSHLAPRNAGDGVPYRFRDVRGPSPTNCRYLAASHRRGGACPSRRSNTPPLSKREGQAPPLRPTTHVIPFPVGADALGGPYPSCLAPRNAGDGVPYRIGNVFRCVENAAPGGNWGRFFCPAFPPPIRKTAACALRRQPSDCRQTPVMPTKRHAWGIVKGDGSPPLRSIE